MTYATHKTEQKEKQMPGLFMHALAFLILYSAFNHKHVNYTLRWENSFNTSVLRYASPVRYRACTSTRANEPVFG